MSINYKRMTDLIEQEVKKLPDLSDKQCERLIKLANKIYLSESTTQAMSSQKMTDEIMDNISHDSDLWRDEGNQ